MNWETVKDLYQKACKVHRYAEYASEMLKLVELLENDNRLSTIPVSNAYLNLVLEIPQEGIRVNVFRESVGVYCIFVEGRKETTRVHVGLDDVITVLLRYLQQDKKNTNNEA